MLKNIFEHTTSIAGLTCKPLSILSETISSQEMSMARGGDSMGGPGSMSSGMDSNQAQRDKAEQAARRAEAQKAVDEQTKPIDTAGLGGPFGGTYIPIIDVSGSLNTTAQADSSGTQDQNGGDNESHLGDFWNFHFLDDTETEDECTVPLDCGDEENDEGNNDEGSGLPDEENSEEGNNG